jgi:hypothetical protein
MKLATNLEACRQARTRVCGPLLHFFPRPVAGVRGVCHRTEDDNHVFIMDAVLGMEEKKIIMLF